jgi:hypothetical protein
MSDERGTTRGPHPIRIAVLMLMCAGLAMLFAPVAGGRDPSDPQHIIPSAYALGGSLVGLR